MLYIPPSYRKTIRQGKDPKFGHSLKRNSDGTYRYLFDPSTAKAMTQVLVRQGFSPEKIRKWHMNPKNMGFYWIRAQEDPQAASDAMIAGVNHSAARIKPMHERLSEIKNLLATSEIFSQKKLVAAIGNPRDSYTRQDIQALAKMGVINVTREQHGKCTWLLISIANTVKAFTDACRTIGQDVRAKMAARNVDYASKELKRKHEKWIRSPEFEVERVRNLNLQTELCAMLAAC